MIHKAITKRVYILLILLVSSVTPTIAKAYESRGLDAFTESSLHSMYAREPIQKEEDTEVNLQELSGVLINVRGMVGYSIPKFKNILAPESNVVPSGFTAPVQGGGAIAFGIRFAMTTEDRDVPLYMRLELEYGQRAPYAIHGETMAFGITDRNGLPDADNGYPATQPISGLAERDFALRVGTQQLQFGIFFDINLNSIVVPYIGAILGLTVYDIQATSTNLEVFNPTHVDGGILYGSIENYREQSSEASFLWGVSAGINIIVNEFISFDLGVRYTNNASITIGTTNVLNLSMTYNYIETLIGINVAL